MRVFMTGATGYIGSVVTERLRTAGHEVAGLARSDESARQLAEHGAHAVRGTLRDAEVIARAASEANAVIHLAYASGADAADADRAVIRAVLGALEGSGKAFVYTSGVWVQGDTAEHTVNEESPLDPATPLKAWRIDTERVVLDAATVGVRAIVIRPSIVYGRGGGIPASFVTTAREGGGARYVGTGQTHWPLVHVDDLAEGYRLALEHAAPGSVFILANGDSVRVLDLARAASRGAGASGLVQSWPLDDARRVLGPYADALVLDQHVSAERARLVLGWRPEGPGALADLEHGSYATTAGVHR